jgi:hypothetical protein
MQNAIEIPQTWTNLNALSGHAVGESLTLQNVSNAGDVISIFISPVEPPAETLGVALDQIKAMVSINNPVSIIWVKYYRIDRSIPSVSKVGRLQVQTVNGAITPTAQSQPVDYYFEVAAGRVPGSTAGLLVGINENLLAGATSILADQGGVFEYLPANTQLAISSSDPTDTDIDVLVVCLDEDYNPVPITGSTNAIDATIQNNLNADTSYRLDSAIVTSSSSPNGQIYISEITPTIDGKPVDEAKIKAQIPLITNTAGDVIDIGPGLLSSTNSTHLGMKTVPAGKRMMITKIIAGTDKGGNIKIFGRIRPPNGSFNFLSRNPASVYQSNVTVEFNPPIAVPEKWDFDFIAVAGVDGTGGQVEAFYILEDIR